MSAATASPLSAPADGGLVGTAARHGAVQLGAVVWAGVMAFLLVVVMTAGLGATGYGAFASAMALFTILTSSARLGADVGLLRGVPRLLAEGAAARLPTLLLAGLGPVLVVSTVAGLATWAWAPELAALVVRGTAGREATAASIRAMALLVPAGALMAVAVVAARGFGGSTFSALVQNVAVPTARPVLVGLVLLTTSGATALATRAAAAWAAPLAGGLVAALVYLVVRCSKELHHHVPPDVPGRRRVTLDLWRFTRARSVAGVLEAVTAWVGVLLVSALSGTADAGVYSAVTRYVVLGLFAMQAVRVAIGPQLSALVAAGRTADTERVLQVMTTWLVLLSWPFYLVLAVFAPLLLGVFGAEFAVGATALVVLCASQLVNAATGNVTLLLLMSGRSGWNLVNVVTSLAVSVGLGLVLIPVHGVTGAAVAWGSAVVVENCLAALQVRRLLGVRTVCREWLVAMASAGTCFGVLLGGVRLLLGSGPLVAVVATAVAVLLFTVVLVRARRLLHLDEAWSSLRRKARTP